MINACIILAGNPEGKKLFGRPRRRWEDNMKEYRKETGCEDVGWVQLGHSMIEWRVLVKTVMNSMIP